MDWRKRQNKNEKRLRFPCRNSPTLECAVPSLRDISGEKKSWFREKITDQENFMKRTCGAWSFFLAENMKHCCAVWSVIQKGSHVFFAQNLGKKNPGIELLSHTQMCSTIVARPLINRVRDGNVSFKPAIDTGKKYVIKIAVILEEEWEKKQNNR